MFDIQQLTDWGIKTPELADWGIETPQLIDWKTEIPQYLTTTGLLYSKLDASIVIVSYNSRSYLETCLNSVCCTVGLDCEVIVVDNASTDGSAQYVADYFPWVKLIRNRKNVGFAAANNQAVRAAATPYIVALNPDTEVEPGWLEALLEPLSTDGPSGSLPVGMTTARILMAGSHNQVNTCGNEMHYTGLTVCRGLNRPADAPEYAVPSDVPAVSGACFAISRDLWEQLGGMDESYFTYLEDTDLSLRVRLAGYRCLYVPKAVVYHSYSGRFSARKFYFLERNRLAMLMKCYRPRTLSFMLPALILAEVVAWGYALHAGPAHVRAKVKAYKWLIKHREEIRNKHEETQRHRSSSDSDLLGIATINLTTEQLAGPVMGRLAGAMLNPAFRLWRHVLQSSVH